MPSGSLEENIKKKKKRILCLLKFTITQRTGNTTYNKSSEYGPLCSPLHPLVRSRVPPYVFGFLGLLQKHNEERNQTLNSTSVSRQKQWMSLFEFFKSTVKSKDKSTNSPRTSLAVRWLRLCIPCRGRGFDAWLEKLDPACFVVWAKIKKINIYISMAELFCHPPLIYWNI